MLNKEQPLYQSIRSKGKVVLANENDSIEYGGGDQVDNFALKTSS